MNSDSCNFCRVMTGMQNCGLSHHTWNLLLGLHFPSARPGKPEISISSGTPPLQIRGKNNGPISINCQIHIPNKVGIKYNSKLSMVVIESK